LLLTPGQRHEATVLVPLPEPGAGKRAGPGRPTPRPPRLVGDQAYSRRAIRQYLRQHGIRITLPRKRGEHRTGPFDRALYRWRNRVERLIKRLNQCRRIATRYEKRAEKYLAMLLIAAIVLWL
jgi:transposase